MPTERSTTFGKRNGVVSTTARKRIVHPRYRSKFLTAVAMAMVVTLSGLAVVLYKNFSSQNAPTPHQTSMVGLWAVDGLECSESKVKLEFDGHNLTTTSSMGRIPIASYAVDGTNPITLTLSDGSQIVWDSTDPDHLVPISFAPLKEGMRKRMTLTRC